MRKHIGRHIVAYEVMVETDCPGSWCSKTYSSVVVAEEEPLIEER
jgi:hypothetical protein